MARIDKGVFRQWRDGERMTAEEYAKDREILSTAINDFQGEVDVLKTTISAVALDALSTEMSEARGAQNSLSNRLQGVDEQLSEVNTQVEGNVQDLNVLKKNAINIFEFESLKVAITGGYDFAPVIQKSVDEAMKSSKDVMVPVGEYMLGSTLIIGTHENQKPVRIIGLGSAGSFLREKPVIFTRPDNTTHTLLKALGHGFNIENICFYGKNTSGNLMEVDRGFELRVRNCRFFKANGHGLLARALSNARIQDTHFDLCGTESHAALRLSGNSSYEYSSNSVHINNIHLERNRGVDLDLAFGNAIDDYAEFILIDGMHIEGTIDNTDVLNYKTTPHIKIGNVRGVEINNSYIYGGKGTLLHYEKQRNSGSSVMSGVSVKNTYFLGHLTSHAVDSATPDRLIDLIAGDGFTMLGCQLDTALVEHIRVGASFGPDVYVQFNHHKSRSGSTSSFVNDQRTGNRNGLDFPNTTFYNNVWALKGSNAKIRINTNGAIQFYTGGEAIDFADATLWSYNGKKVRYQTAPPTSGTYAVGDKVWNTNPTSGGKAGWICVAAGTPGTWKGFGTIDA
ncbi:hypothetical protein [Cytobacillus oceanisediminis]|uniref:hypothetical protein n=1 Tax=Cytobacillus oceanisediminis TaxID=665099 RepID=UPI001C243472|nr:hypothetical protein [Cytobacillus oceanisediminis]MBU8770337.1 hypothetical protein [Cytobacillus oceanisediminis]